MTNGDETARPGDEEGTGTATRAKKGGRPGPRPWNGEAAAARDEMLQMQSLPPPCLGRISDDPPLTGPLETPSSFVAGCGWGTRATRRTRSG